MYCEWCGTYLDENIKYCPACGKKNPGYVNREHVSSKKADRNMQEERYSDISSDAVAVKKPKRKGGVLIAVGVILVVCAVVLILGFNADLKYPELVSEKMHEMIVDKSQAAQVVTMTTSYTQDGAFAIETYAYDLGRERYYRQRLMATEGSSNIYVEFDYVDLARNKKCSYHNYLAESAFGQNRIQLKAEDGDYSSYGYAENYKRSIHSAMSAPGRGCANIASGKAFSGDFYLDFDDSYIYEHNVRTQDFKVSHVVWFGQEYDFTYSFVESSYFVVN